MLKLLYVWWWRLKTGLHAYWQIPYHWLSSICHPLNKVSVKMLFKRGTPGSLNCWHLLFLIEVARTEFFCFRFSFFPALLCHQSLSKHGGSLVLFLKYATYNRAYINIFFHLCLVTRIADWRSFI